MKNTTTRILIQPRDKKVLLSLWRWKFLSLAAIHQLHFKDVSLARCYNRLRELVGAKLILANFIPDMEGTFWTLDKAGFQAIQLNLSEQISCGYKSEYPHHDVICAAVQLSIVANYQLGDTDFITEQELRRLDPSVLPEWISKTQIHRADGYFAFAADEDPHVFAMEIELTLKSKARYKSLGQFYDYQDSLAGVLWFVSSRCIARTIQTNVSSRKAKHHFILVDDFKQSHMQATVVAGPSSSKTLGSILPGFDSLDMPRQSDNEIPVNLTSGITNSRVWNCKRSYWGATIS